MTGPARSGKSEWAEALAEQAAAAANQQLIYIATAQRNPSDADWQARIEKHVQRRSAAWQCDEVPVALAEAIAQYNASHCLLIDSLGTWLANLIAQSDEQWQTSQVELIAALRQTEATVILVAEETGWGVIPAYEMGRTFRDRLGVPQPPSRRMRYRCISSGQWLCNQSSSARSTCEYVSILGLSDS